jgi:UDP-N-acetylglucosamine transferase subunit ALG13
MIFATVGTQGQFDRLIRAVDEWAGAQRRTDVFAQTGPSDYRSEHIRTERFIDPTEFRKRVEAASVVISHAGMGSIITALELGKRIIVMPRRASLGEHRNDHQLATAKRFAEQGRITVAFSEQELVDKLDRLQVVAETERLSAQASPGLIATIRTFIGTGRNRFENGDVSS